ncbi:MAG: hypothetical protein K6F50_08820 [Kiritimatiellae bacterium]|nr:hypothetical protein [Kiritimatiellia bacterium]
MFETTGLTQIGAHKALWSQVKHYGRVDPSWFVMHSKLSGVEDYRYVPENVYFPYIEPILNDLEFASSIADKNRLEDFVPREHTPPVVLRYIRGEFFDENLAWLSDTAAQRRLDDAEELVVKPSTDSSGGNGVLLWNRSKDGPLSTSDLRKYGSVPLIVQLKVKQHMQTAVFNPGSINTCRIMTLRCPWNGLVVPLKAMLRMGTRSSFCDNMMLGGLCLGIGGSGELTKYAYDYDGKRYDKHPVTSLMFSGRKLELFPSMEALACDIARRIPYMNILSFDMVAEPSGNVICLEINTAGQGITQLQYDGVPLFHKYTDAVIGYCKSHRNLGRFRHFRTFYW